MHAGKSYKLSEFLVWTRRKIYALFIIGLIPVILYQVLDFKWLDIPWPIIGFMGTSAAFIVGFTNTQTYKRTDEGQQMWTTIFSLSRSWGIISRDFFNNPEKSRLLIYRHMAWLTALRYQLREGRIWESANKKHNAEYQQYYCIPEWETSFESELAKYLSGEELKYILGTNNKATQILSLQSQTIKQLYEQDEIVVLQFVEMERSLRDFYTQQARNEQMKNSPYPRQYAIINTFFIWLFCFMLPFGMLKDFDRLNDVVQGAMKGYMVWLVVPFSTIISWIYISLEQVGESTENPFEGSANDVPISQMSRSIEIELREFLGEIDLPAELQPQNDIIL
ncbi:bestrophin family protein [Mucilaginibacter aquaedulcis]|uniref:bestrophin family protein n=1 Tax=Mucilaginibacter aquaedulcis TaxID=1187081 RepID=UPI0025B60DE6|nr:bestrophin family ion channel [Mucilaginibacter aquaedulcis]MDN3551544.1 bestrophin family ion channel [Mucilaginibacter aquaedulcis]